MTIGDTDITAPALLWMNTGRARVVAAVFIALTLLSLPDYGNPDPHLPLLCVAVLIVAVGVAVLVLTRSDPMPRRSAIIAGACPPLAAVVTGIAIPGPLVAPGQANALGSGVALCAFMCVRGRTGTAWASQVVTVIVFSAWGHWTGQGWLTGFLVVLPNLAVLMMATLFARIMRPAAISVRRLHEEAERETALLADAQARAVERQRQNAKLQDLAWPTVEVLASGTELTAQEISDARLTEARLRDSVRAPILDAPSVVEAARRARSRGVDVVLIDDHGMDDSRHDVTAFHDQAVVWLDNAHDGRITVRVLPPGRSSLATIVAVTADGTESDLVLAADGTVAG